jgi:hypothetical protein
MGISEWSVAGISTGHAVAHSLEAQDCLASASALQTLILAGLKLDAGVMGERPVVASKHQMADDV